MADYIRGEGKQSKGISLSFPVGQSGEWVMLAIGRKRRKGAVARELACFSNGQMIRVEVKLSLLHYFCLQTCKLSPLKVNKTEVNVAFFLLI